MGAILITRPEPGASDTARLLEGLGFKTVKAPFLVIERCPARLPRRMQACLVTSANAVWALPTELPVFAVGDATAAHARAAGAETVHSAAGDAIALADLVVRSCDPANGALLLLSGEDQGRSLARGLRSKGFTVVRRVVYRATAVAMFPPAAERAIAAGAVDSVLFFSAETARAFAALLPAALAPKLSAVRAVTLSETISLALAHLRWRRLAHASAPTQEALLKLLHDELDPIQPFRR